jgi:hypothetical protein
MGGAAKLLQTMLGSTRGFDTFRHMKADGMSFDKLQTGKRRVASQIQMHGGVYRVRDTAILDEKVARTEGRFPAAREESRSPPGARHCSRLPAARRPGLPTSLPWHSPAESLSHGFESEHRKFS